MRDRGDVRMSEARPDPSLAAVLIGRNEGERLIRCLASIRGQIGRIVYVDSGSTDGSVAAALAAGADVVQLDTRLPFTAARARNAGLAALREGGPLPEFVQFVDGDCEVQPGWIETARRFLEARPRAAVACGRRRERFPQASVYNRLCDAEWDTPVGEAFACGGDALMRREALDQVGGYNPSLIAGEEPEMCVRLRAKGWQIWRLDAEMTVHDAAIMRLSQWWKRMKRAGHAYAEGAHLHPGGGLGEAGQRRALLWGLALPVLAVSGTVFTPLAPGLFLLWPLQVVRLAARDRFSHFGWQMGFFNTLGKLAEAQGALEFHLRRLTGQRSGLIEYK